MGTGISEGVRDQLEEILSSEGFSRNERLTLSCDLSSSRSCQAAGTSSRNRSSGWKFSADNRATIPGRIRWSGRKRPNCGLDWRNITRVLEARW